MTRSNNQHGRHRRENPTTSLKNKRFLTATAATLAVTGGIQMAAATTSSAALGPSSTPTASVPGSSPKTIAWSMAEDLDPIAKKIGLAAMNIWDIKVTDGKGTLFTRDDGRPALLFRNSTTDEAARLSSAAGLGATQVSRTQRTGTGGVCGYGEGKAQDASGGYSCQQAEKDIYLSTPFLHAKDQPEDRKLSVGVHEVGHGLGLGHTIKGPDEPCSVMSANPTSCYPTGNGEFYWEKGKDLRDLRFVTEPDSLEVAKVKEAYGYGPSLTSGPSGRASSPRHGSTPVSSEVDREKLDKEAQENGYVDYAESLKIATYYGQQGVLDGSSEGKGRAFPFLQRVWQQSQHRTEGVQFSTDSGTNTPVQKDQQGGQLGSQQGLAGTTTGEQSWATGSNSNVVGWGRNPETKAWERIGRDSSGNYSDQVFYGRNSDTKSWGRLDSESTNLVGWGRNPETKAWERIGRDSSGNYSDTAFHRYTPETGSWRTLDSGSTGTADQQGPQPVSGSTGALPHGQTQAQLTSGGHTLTGAQSSGEVNSQPGQTHMQMAAPAAQQQLSPQSGSGGSAGGNLLTGVVNALASPRPSSDDTGGGFGGEGSQSQQDQQQGGSSSSVAGGAGSGGLAAGGAGMGTVGSPVAAGGAAEGATGGGTAVSAVAGTADGAKLSAGAAAGLQGQGLQQADSLPAAAGAPQPQQAAQPGGAVQPGVQSTDLLARSGLQALGGGAGDVWGGQAGSSDAPSGSTSGVQAWQSAPAGGWNQSVTGAAAPGEGQAAGTSGSPTGLTGDSAAFGGAGLGSGVPDAGGQAAPSANSSATAGSGWQAGTQTDWRALFGQDGGTGAPASAATDWQALQGNGAQSPGAWSQQGQQQGNWSGAADQQQTQQATQTDWNPTGTGTNQDNGYSQNGNWGQNDSSYNQNNNWNFNNDGWNQQATQTDWNSTGTGSSQDNGWDQQGQQQGNWSGAADQQQTQQATQTDWQQNSSSSGGYNDGGSSGSW